VSEEQLAALEKKAAEVAAALEAKQSLLSQVQRDYDETSARLEILKAAKDGPSAEAMRLERERQLLARIHSLQETNAGLQSERERSMDERDALVREEERLNGGGRRGSQRSLRRSTSMTQ
jgi:hypothetical protein